MSAVAVRQALIERVRANVPRLLRELPVWLLHDAAKTPIYASGVNRHGTLDSPGDRAQLVTFEVAAEALPYVQRAVGLGVALGKVPGEEIWLSGFDLDHCYVNGELDERAAQLLLAANSYAEKSLSGLGLHVVGTGNTGTLKTDGLEIYPGGRFFTVTGEALNGAALTDITDAAAFARKLYGTDATNGTGEEPTTSARPDSDPVVAALKHTGLYIRDGGGGKHLHRCPWEALHTPDEHAKRNTSSTEAAYFAPGAPVRGERSVFGGFKCQHAHCARRGLKDLRDFLGLAAPAADVEVRATIEASVDPDTEDTATFPLRWFKDLAEITPRSQIVKGLLVAGSLVLVYGESNVGKSFWLLDLALKLAAGYFWRGRRTRRGLVLYIAAESADSIAERVAAYRKQHSEAPPGVPFAVIPHAVDLLDEDSVKKLLRTIRGAESECSEKTILIVIDTFARSIPGGNENDAHVVGRAVQAADQIRTAIGACVIFVHHAGKDTSKGARGSSALLAAVDTEILTEGQTGPRTITVKKQRDLPIGDWFAFELQTVVIGTDEDGEAVTSCIVAETNAPEHPAVTRIKGANKVKLFAALKEWRRENPDKEIISSIELERIAKAQGLADRRRKAEVTRGLEKDGVLKPSVGGHRLVLEGFST